MAKEVSFRSRAVNEEWEKLIQKRNKFNSELQSFQNAKTEEQKQKILKEMVKSRIGPNNGEIGPDLIERLKLKAFQNLNLNAKFVDSYLDNRAKFITKKIFKVPDSALKNIRTFLDFMNKNQPKGRELEKALSHIDTIYENSEREFPKILHPMFTAWELSNIMVLANRFVPNYNALSHVNEVRKLIKIVKSIG